MDSACRGGSDEKIPPPSGTNQIAWFVEFPPLKSYNNKLLKLFELKILFCVYCRLFRIYLMMSIF